MRKMILAAMVSVCAAVVRSEVVDLGEVFSKAESWALDAETFLGDYQKF